MLLGDNLLPLLVLAIAGALVAGNALALVRPPAARQEGGLDKAPVARSVAMMAVGLVAAVWALATLTS